MLKKIFIIFVCVLLLSGCSSRENQEEITFSSWGSITEVQVLKHIIEDFENDNPDIKVKFIHIPQNYFQKLHLLFASNTAPDIVFINNLNLPRYASLLFDLSEYIQSSEFYEQSIEGLSYEGKIFAFPRDISNLVFYVNTDLMELPFKDWTLEDLLRYSEKIKRKGILSVSFEEDLYWVLPYLSYYGEARRNEFSSVNLKGLNFYKDLRYKYEFAPTKSQIGSSTQAQMFLDGKIAMYLSGRWMYPKIKEKATFNWAVINFPYGITKQPCDTSGWAISKNSEHKVAALRFVKYLSSEKSSSYFAETGLIVPARINIAQRLNNEEHNEKAFVDVINHSTKTFSAKNYKKIVDEFNKRNFN